MTRTITSGLGQAHTFRYKVTVFARFQVAVRDNTDSENVFPDADPMPIPASMADADGRNFQRKLWAKGANIKITRVETATGNNDFFLRGEGNSMYDVTEDSCIDMMFKTDPPETMPDGAGPPFYCLGRCDHPPIINTKWLVNIESGGQRRRSLFPGRKPASMKFLWPRQFGSLVDCGQAPLVARDVDRKT